MTTALSDFDCDLASPADDVASMTKTLLHAFEQPSREATYQPQSVRDVLRRLALDVAAARMLVSEVETAASRGRDGR